MWGINGFEGPSLSVLTTNFKQRISIMLQKLRAFAILTLSWVVVVGLGASWLPSFENLSPISTSNILFVVGRWRMKNFFYFCFNNTWSWKFPPNTCVRLWTMANLFLSYLVSLDIILTPLVSLPTISPFPFPLSFFLGIKYLQVLINYILTNNLNLEGPWPQHSRMKTTPKVFL